MEIEVIQIRENGEEHYHKKPVNEKYQFYKSVIIPSQLFDSYIEARTLMLDYRKRVRHYFRLPKDKPMWIAKNHIHEGEVHHFGDDGEIIIKKK